jgi:Ca2+-binding EF-hand superfamily protein
MKKITKILLGTAAAASFATAACAYAAPGGEPRGDLTRAQAQEQAVKMFERMDANKDGKLDAADREARMAERFDRLDTNKDGSLSREEFAARPAHDGQRFGGPDGKPGFDGHRGGGKHRGMGRMGPGGHGGHGPMMKQADTNGDGAISQAEFVAARLAMFDKVDANKDGTVTAQERKDAHQKMREEWRAKRAAEKPAN